MHITMTKKQLTWIGVGVFVLGFFIGIATTPGSSTLSKENEVLKEDIALLRERDTKYSTLKAADDLIMLTCGEMVQAMSQGYNEIVEGDVISLERVADEAEAISDKMEGQINSRKQILNDLGY